MLKKNLFLNPDPDDEDEENYDTNKENDIIDEFEDLDEEEEIALFDNDDDEE